MPFPTGNLPVPSGMWNVCVTHLEACSKHFQLYCWAVPGDWCVLTPTARRALSREGSGSPSGEPEWAR